MNNTSMKKTDIKIKDKSSKKEIVNINAIVNII